MKRATLIFAILAGAVFAACGGVDDAEPTAEPNTSEDATAQSMLLTIQDFPTGWTQIEDDGEDEESPFDALCDIEPADIKITGRAETGDFESSSQATISQNAAVYESDGEVERVNAALDEFFDCMVGAINDGELDDDGVKFSNAKKGELSMPAFGESMTSTRISFQAEQEDIALKPTFYLDIVGIQQGRYLSVFFAFDSFSPFDTAMLTEVLEKAEAKFPAGQ